MSWAFKLTEGAYNALANSRYFYRYVRSLNHESEMRGIHSAIKQNNVNDTMTHSFLLIAEDLFPES